MNGTFTSALLQDPPVEVSEGHYLLKARIDPPVDSKPGQFVNIRPGPGTAPLIRRPFSIYNREGDSIEIIVSVVGSGTERISTFIPGEIDMIGPLGKGFSPVKDSRILIAGGGVGNAPLYYLARELKKSGNHITWVFGARSEKYIFCREVISEISDRFLPVTDDGTSGEKGYASDIARNLLEDTPFDMIYTCGPAAMMEQIVAISGDIPVEVSVENYFGCGIGLCAGCTIETVNGQKRACVQGPVFDGKKIKWDTVERKSRPLSSNQ